VFENRVGCWGESGRTLHGTTGQGGVAGYCMALQDSTQREASGFALPNGQINSKTGGEWGNLERIKCTNGFGRKP